MNGEQIIKLFELYLDDTSDMSSDEELALLNRVYHQILGDKQWEFLKKEGTGTTSISVPYVSLPSDFKNLTENHQYTDISEGQGNSVSKTIFVGSQYSTYKVINFSDRRQYRESDGYAYIDIVNNRLVFTQQPTSAQPYEFDYIYRPADITLTTEPVFPERFHSMIAFGMAVDGFIIQLFEKTRSYAGENKAEYNKYLEDLSYWNSNLRCE